MVPHTSAQALDPGCSGPCSQRPPGTSSAYQWSETQKLVKHSKDFPGYPVVKTTLSGQGDWVSSLTEELEPHSTTKIEDLMYSN